MFSKYFGHYLLNKKIVTPLQLADALDFQHSVHVKLGVLAVNAGYLSASQVTEILLMQSKVDKKFGELAIQMGYFNNEQLEELLTTQKKGYLLLGQALIDKEYLSLEQLQTALNEYKKDHGLSAMKDGEIEELINALVNLGNLPLKNISLEYISLMIRNIIRFIDVIPGLETSWITKKYSAPWLIYQEIYGPFSLFTGIASTEKDLLEFAGKFANERFLELNELAQASVAEFLNLHNGIFLVNMSNSGIELEMKPQVCRAEQNLTGLETGYVIPIYIYPGKIDLIISESTPSFL